MQVLHAETFYFRGHRFKVETALWVWSIFWPYSVISTWPNCSNSGAVLLRSDTLAYEVVSALAPMSGDIDTHLFACLPGAVKNISNYCASIWPLICGLPGLVGRFTQKSLIRELQSVSIVYLVTSPGLAKCRHVIRAVEGRCLWRATHGVKICSMVPCSGWQCLADCHA